MYVLGGVEGGWWCVGRSGREREGYVRAGGSVSSSREVGLDHRPGADADEKEVKWAERAGAMRASRLPGVRVVTYLSCCTRDAVCGLRRDECFFQAA